jgi:transcriptional antiterminator NusG
MKNWVILFARTGSEEKLVQILKEKLDAEEYLPFIPTKEIPFRRQGIIRAIRKPLFPGYVFVQTDIEAELIADKLKASLKDIKNIYSLLHYGSNTKDVTMRESERQYWERLFDADFCIAGSTGFFEGNKICVTSGVLLGLEEQIKRVTPRRREAIVEMQMMGATREVTLMLEVVSVVS